MKIAPIYRQALMYDSVDSKIVHTGQHYDFQMSQAFFEDLELPEPHFFLNAGSGTHAEQTAKIMVPFEEICIRERPDCILVVGDVNSTLACSIVAKKLLIKVAHVEAGLRSFDQTMPEEINRMVTDAISDYLFVTEESGVQNLLREGKDKETIHFAGNVMIDNLLYQLRKITANGGREFTTYDLKNSMNGYVFLTLHRPSNVDNRETFTEICEAINEIAAEKPVFFPVHPRTRNSLNQFDVSLSQNITLLPPLGFSESLFLWKDAAVVLTDSGGLQEETTALGVPCVTLRENTERPITIKMGTNILAGVKKDKIIDAYRASVKRERDSFMVPPKWDGKASERIWEILLKSMDAAGNKGTL